MTEGFKFDKEKTVPWVQLVFLVLLSFLAVFVVHTACAYIYIFVDRIYTFVQRWIL